MLFLIFSFLSLRQVKRSLEKTGLTPLPKKTLLSITQSQWYFIRFSSDKDIKLIKSLLPQVKITSLSFDQNYLTLFLTPKEAQQLNSLDNIHVFYRTPRKSTLRTLPKNETFVIYAHTTFNAPQFSKIISHNGPFYFLRTSQPSKIESDPSVLYIKQIPTMNILNRWTTGFLQSGDEQLITKNGFYTSNRKYNERGLTGSNVIVTLIDTGADMNNCLFRDPSVPAPFNKTDFNHRKVVRYDPFVDASDQYAGHGTHCAGTIAGSTESSPMSLYNGHAPDAKLYVADVGKDEEDNIQIDLANFFDIVDQSKILKSPIISCSWGSNMSVPELTSIFDYMCYDDPSQLYVFAAGNDGLQYSVGSPSNSKNVLTVAASYPPRSFFLGYYPLNLVQLRDNDQVLNVTSHNAFNAMTKYQLNWFNNIEVVKYDGASEHGENDYVDKAVIIPQKSPNYDDIFDLLVKYKAKLAIVYDDVNATHDQLVVLSAKSVDGEFFDHHPIVNLTIDTVRRYNDVTVAPFSSQGPSINGNRKPDVMAPGFYISSAGHHPYPDECDVVTSILIMSGTSMATPAVSGSLALVYQYLSESLHRLPQDDTKNITSPLLRAFAIASSGSAADNAQGYGNINLSRILIYPDEDKGRGLRFRSGELSSNEHVAFTVKTNSVGPLSFSLAWIDIPINSESVVPLFAYLDMFVIGPNGEVTDCGEEFSTTKKIVIENAQPGTYEVRIRSNTIREIEENVYYGLVIVGSFDHLNFNENPSELQVRRPSNCASKCHSQCDQSSASCICDKYHTGTFCELSIEKVDENENSLKTIRNRDFWYMHFDLSKYKEKSQKEIERLAVFVEIKVTAAKGEGIIRYFVNSDNLARLSIPRFLIALQDELSSTFQIPLTDFIENGGFYFTAFNDVYSDVTLSLKWKVRDTRNLLDQFTHSKWFKIVLITLIVVLSLSIVISIIVLIVWYVKYKKMKRRRHHHEENTNQTEDMKVALVENAQEV